ncbi:MAG: ribonuclease III [Acidimicrobiales bacterium]
MADCSEDDGKQAFLDALGHLFTDVSLLDLAFTHRSFCAENDGHQSNERLEFLGDAVLGLAITDAIFRNQPDQAEGDLAKARAEVVSTTSLADLARDIGIGPLLRLGKGEDMSEGRNKDSILADAMEAVIGAVYLDSDWKTVLTVIDRLLGPAAAEAQVTPGVRDYKTRLQEIAADRGFAAPYYHVSSSGPDHGRVFTADVQVGEVGGFGVGSSKKQAQQEAAARALDELESRHTADLSVGEGAE